MKIVKTAKAVVSAVISGLIIAASVPAAPCFTADAASLCTINTSKTYQTIRGFGGINLPEWVGEDGAFDMIFEFSHMLVPTGGKELDLFAVGQLTFERPDAEKFPALRMAYQALRQGGAACCVLNAANEEACFAFLAGKIPFGRIPEIVDAALQRHASLPARSLSDIDRADALSRECAKAMIQATGA